MFVPNIDLAIVVVSHVPTNIVLLIYCTLFPFQHIFEFHQSTGKPFMLSLQSCSWLLRFPRRSCYQLFEKTVHLKLRQMDPAVAKAYKAEHLYFSYTTRDAIIYALGIGARAKDDLRYVYENDESFVPIPTFVVNPGLTATRFMRWPGFEADLSKILHGEQYIEVFAPLPSEGKLRSETRVIDILDKGKGVLCMFEVTTYDEATGKKLALQQFGLFQIGSGGFGGARSSSEEVKAADIPARAPDAVIEQITSVDQTTLYRLGSGDMNPLHIDPTFAQRAGFEGPILHGLCSLGFATRHVIKAWADNDFAKFKALKVRFSSPVMPGQTLQTETWKDEDKIIFQVKAKETGKVVLSNGWIQLSEASEKPNVPDHFAVQI